VGLYSQISHHRLLLRVRRLTSHSPFSATTLATRALELALANRDWVRAEAAKKMLGSLDAATAAGIAVRNQTPLADNEEPALHWPHHHPPSRWHSTHRRHRRGSRSTLSRLACSLKLRGRTNKDSGTTFHERLFPELLKGLQSPGLDPIAVDTHFSLLHDLLDIRATRHHMRMEDAPTPSCIRYQPSAPLETLLHFFTSCERVSAAWYFLFFKATLTLGCQLSDESLFKLAWPPSLARAEAAVILAVTTFSSWAWASRGDPDLLAPPELQARVRAAAADSPTFSIFKSSKSGSGGLASRILTGSMKSATGLQNSRQG
jgi:hypothetical protein